MYTSISIFKQEQYKVENHPDKIGVYLNSADRRDVLFFANDMLPHLEQAAAIIKQNLADNKAASDAAAQHLQICDRQPTDLSR